MDLWAFSRADLATLLGVSERALSGLLSTGARDPTDLASVCEAWLARRAATQ